MLLRAHVRSYMGNCSAGAVPEIERDVEAAVAIWKQAVESGAEDKVDCNVADLFVMQG